MFFSIVIPIYNTEQYLSKCIDSVLAQSYSDFELLLIDDGSTDKSSKICDEYAAKDERIRVFHQKNAGVSSARNVGLDNARGEWICFVDSDDTIAVDALSNFSRSAEENVDFVFSRYCVVDEKGFKLREYETLNQNCEMTLRDFLEILYAPKIGCYQGYIFNKVFRMSVIREHAIRFSKKIYFNEDRLFVTQYVCASRKSVKFLDALTYSYLIHPNSAMASLNHGYNRKFVTDFDALILMKKEIEKLPFGKDLRSIIIREICNSYYRNHNMMMRFDDYDTRNHWHMLFGLVKSGAWLSLLKKLKIFLVCVFFRFYMFYKKNVAN